jgi:hypothetical protein
MKYFHLGILVLFSLSSLSLGKSKKTNHLIMVAATKQDWHAGIRGGGSGTNYNIYFVLKTADKITFDSLQLAEGLKVPAQINYKINEWNKPLHVNDTVNVIAGVTTYDWNKFLKQGKPNSISQSANSYLIYHTNNKRFVASIPKFQVLAVENRP